MSAAKAICDHMRDWWHGTKDVRGDKDRTDRLLFDHLERMGLDGFDQRWFVRYWKGLGLQLPGSNQKWQNLHCERLENRWLVTRNARQNPERIGRRKERCIQSNIGVKSIVKDNFSFSLTSLLSSFRFLILIVRRILSLTHWWTVVEVAGFDNKTKTRLAMQKHKIKISYWFIYPRLISKRNCEPIRDLRGQSSACSITQSSIGLIIHTDFEFEGRSSLTNDTSPQRWSLVFVYFKSRTCSLCTWEWKWIDLFIFHWWSDWRKCKRG